MSGTKKTFSIRGKLGLLFSVCILALVVILAAVVNIRLRRQSEADFHANAKAQLEHIANGIQIFFNEILNNLDMLSKNVDVRNADDTLHTHINETVPVRVDSVQKSPTEQKLTTLFKNFDNAFPEYVEVYLGTKWGGYATCFDGEMAAGYDPRKRGWYTLASSGGGKAMITDAFASTVGAVVVGVTKSIYDFDNEFLGNVSIEVTLTTLTDIISNSKIGKSGYVILLQEDGTVLANPRHSEMNFTNISENGIKGYDALLNFEGAGNDIFMDGTLWASEIFSIGSPKWKLIAFQEKSEMMNNASSIVTSICIVSIALLLFFCAIVILFSSRMLRPLKPIKAALLQLENGDFSKTISVSGNDEFSMLADSFNSFIQKIQKEVHTLKDSEELLEDSREKLNAGTADTINSIEEIGSDIDEFNQTIKKQTQSVEQTANAMNKISSNISSLGDMVSTQNSAAQNASSAVEQMLGNIKSVNASAEKLSESFFALEQNSCEGVQKHQNMNEKITQIQTESAMLAEANSVISSIAAQTNLLAMNAAIEAAHAGDAGKGFSVVADEIRKLSENSSAQSKTISQKLIDIQNSIQDVVAASNDAGTALNGISDKVNETNALVQEISQAMREQEAGSKQISDSLLTLNNSSADVRTASEQMGESGKTILNEVRVLQYTTGEMDVRMDGLDEKSVAMKSAQGKLSALSKELDNAIRAMRASLEKFRIS